MVGCLQPICSSGEEMRGRLPVKASKADSGCFFILLRCLPVVGLLAGCNSQPVRYQLTSPDLPDKVSSSNIVILAEGDQVQARVERSNLSTYTLGGIIPVLIDALINSARQDLADELTGTASRNLADFSVSEQLRHKLEENRQAFSWLKVRDIARTEGEGTKEATVKKLLASGNEDLLIVVKPTTYFLPDFDGLMMKLTAYVYPGSAQLMEYKVDQKEEVSEMTSHTDFSYFELSNATKDKKSNMEKWASNSGAEIRRAIREGTNKLGNNLVSYLRKPFPVTDRSR